MLVLGAVIALIVPVLIRKLTFLDRWTYVYAAVGGAALLAVALFAQISGGARLGFEIMGINIQPSEFVKILFVFYVASSLNKSKEFKNIVITTAVAAAHVLILVLSTDLGAALIFFVVYLVMLYVATRQPLYAIAGLLAGAGAAVIGYHLFAPYTGACGSVAGSHRHIRKQRLPGGTVTVRHRKRQLVRNRTVPGVSRT